MESSKLRVQLDMCPYVSKVFYLKNNHHQPDTLGWDNIFLLLFIINVVSVKSSLQTRWQQMAVDLPILPPRYLFLQINPFSPSPVSKRA